MNVKSYLSIKTKITKGGVEGLGLFALESIKKGEIIGIKAGHILTKDTLKNIGGLKSNIGQAMLQISDEFFVGPLKEEEIKDSMMSVNHSCKPNIGILGNVISVAMRDIGQGEELTNDYAMWLSDNKYQLECKCSQQGCRRVITGNDWKMPNLQQKYKGYFSQYIQRKIDGEKRLPN
ncbi:MAG: SET domain-containing protein-lysine N-methyltransferase [Patescibacteria group bacterium]